MGDDLHQRRPASVEVDQREIGALDAPGAAVVDQLGRVLLEEDPLDPHPLQLAPPAQRQVVLGDLVALRQVGIEVVLAVEDRPLRQLAAKGGPDHQRVPQRLLVDHRQGAGQPQADGADVGVRGIAEGDPTAAEELGPGGELDVDLQADHRLQLPASYTHPSLPEKPSAPSRAWAASSSSCSLKWGPASCSPTGSCRPPSSAKPQGIEIAGIPASDIGTVK